jgi:outer membrane receptor protein involved in Fe transport
VSVTPQLITRRRGNAAGASVRGVEADVRASWGGWTAEAAWLLADSRFSTRERLPQVPRQQGSLQLAWSRGRTILAAGLRASTYQFEDDRNLFPLAGYALFHLTARQRISTGLAATFALENAFNREFIVAVSPTPLTGAPRLWRLGLRWER